MDCRILSQVPTPLPVAPGPLAALTESEEPPCRRREAREELLREPLFTRKYPSEITLQAKHVFSKYVALSP